MKSTDWLDHPVTTILMWIIIITVAFFGLQAYSKYEMNKQENRASDPDYKACLQVASLKNDELRFDPSIPDASWECNSDNEPVLRDNLPDYCDQNRC